MKSIVKGGVKMDKKILAGILIVGILIVGAYLYNGQGASVSASGQSVIEVQPDRISVNVNVQEKDKSAQIVQSKVKEISDATVRDLKSIGIAEEDIQLVGFNVYPNYDYTSEGRKEDGFIGSQQIVVKSEDFTEIGKIVDAVIRNGALVSYINFELSQELENEYKVQALEEAGKDAKRKAEATASGIGKKLGKLISVESSDFNYQPWAYYTASAELGVADAKAEVEDAVARIAPRSTEVRANVMVRYKIR